MRQFAVVGVLCGLMALAASPAAHAQSGYIRSIQAQSDSTKSPLPKINLPKPEWEKMLDIQATDGTAPVPSCGDPSVILTVRDGIVDVMNEKYERAGGRGALVKKADLGEVWVKPTFSGRFVCNMTVQLDVPFTGPEEWQFQTIARNGKSSVAFFNLSSRS